MGNEVYANGREISSKSCDGKSVAAFPDVCFTPPQTPATPPGVPIPYPNTGMASDTTDGSKTVQIGGQEVMLKNKSYFKKSSGDEAGSAPKKGLVTSKIQGKIYFTSWSMDVKFEGENVVRHLDMTTHNHASPAPNTPPWVHKASQMFAKGGVCAGMDHLKLQPYNKPCPKTKAGKKQTGHHLIPGRCMRDISNYSHAKAPVICASRGNQHQGSHKRCHAKFDPVELDHFSKGKDFKYSSGRDAAAASAGGACDPPKKLTEKEKACVAAQLDSYYKAKPPNGPGCTENTILRASGKSGKVIPPAKSAPGGF